MMNEDLPYEQQMKPILASYDRLVSENQELKNRVTELEKTLEEERIKAAHKAEGGTQQPQELKQKSSQEA